MFKPNFYLFTIRKLVSSRHTHTDIYTIFTFLNFLHSYNIIFQTKILAIMYNSTPPIKVHKTVTNFKSDDLVKVLIEIFNLLWAEALA